MKKHIFLAAAAFTFLVAGCEQKKTTTEQTTTTEVAATPTIDNPNVTNAQEVTPAGDAPVISFKETEHDFGTIKDGEVVNHTFTFTNTGKSPLIIESATSTCGCTVPEVPKEPIAPGAEGSIKVEFNSSGKGGQQAMKTITVKANTQPVETMVNIKANILAAAGANGPLRSN